MTTKKLWEWKINQNVDEWGDPENLEFFPISETKEMLEFLEPNDQVELWLRFETRYGCEIDSAELDLELLTLPKETDNGYSTIPKYIRKQLDNLKTK